MAEGEKIIQINIEDEMKSAYIDYSMSVIVSRALPDVRDGFKPVHRRVLYGMQDLGVFSNRPYKKSARIVGEVLGKYHPHGDSSVYDTMVRMAQPWSLRYPLVDGQGNFGSVDGDSPAAMRYTEARLRKIAEEMLDDLEKETVDFRPNFDDSLQEPTVMPTKIPNLLINGAAGIAVGMATNMAPHNLTEVVDGTIAYIENRDITPEELLNYIKAPDFPTGGIIYGYEGVRDALLTGRGRVVIRGKAEIEEENGREQIIITEIPYQVNKAEMIKKIADLVNDKKIEGISDLRDESDRNGMRIVFEIKRDAIANVVLNKLYKFTQLQTSFSVNNICLVDGRPRLLNVRDLIQEFVEFRHEVVIRRTRFELRKAEERAHILEGLIIASDNIDEVIEIIKTSASPDAARDRLAERFGLSDIQTRAIVDMRLRQLTGLEQDKLRAEFDELMKLIADLKDILDREERRMQIITDELIEVRAKYGDDRRSRIEYNSSEMRMEDLIADEEVVVTISHAGYIKRTNLAEYKVQNRGGMGSKGSATRDQDFLEHLFVATNHNYLLIFTEKGRCFWMRVYEIPEGSKTSKGRAIQNLINIPGDDKVKAYVKVLDLTDKEYVENNFIVMCTKQGVIKKTSLEAYSRPRSNGINAIGIRDNDELLEAKLTNGSNEIVLATSDGRAIRFNESTVRPMGRNASGVRGVNLSSDAECVIGMICVEDIFSTILVVSEKGYGKRTFLNDPEDKEPVYRITNRGGKGVKTLNITEKTGKLLSIQNVFDEDDLMIITKSGVTIRMHIDTLRTMGRAAQGVKLINLKANAEIAAIARVPRADDEEEEATDENTESGTEIENNEAQSE
ncbi:MAG: DNA gyrase subunit A [Crocinitomicaceae bacterium]|jgi:DNA gyrase subunit A|nr:DNA gyrase subunit A [Crocinitomicaceae bacterium]MDP4722819.1 DNA gyrase subunit A [Crocinitomicaceae bacterium]MDP4798905.1 DNA gyrase subunit A [Crocinitomicaceae bacterium]MDP4805595.1 DNA gyrase subunit A [Crocinitomicaceae bacterium]MDP4867786.1 DNA gyrase subunit A [Crocinitomicaceae bacterium]